LQSMLRDSMYHFVQGSTDSEWAFALFLNQFDDPLHGSFTSEEIKEALMNTIRIINDLVKEFEIEEVSLLNFAVSDGRTIACSRYCNSRSGEPASLFFSSGSRFEEQSPGTYRMVSHLSHTFRLIF
jgi:glutamine amidotransferase